MHLSAPAVKRRVDRLERDGVIRGYTATVDAAVFGWHTEAFVDLFCDVYADGVPPDGLEEVYRLHERARGGLERIDPHAAAASLSGRPGAPTSRPATARRSRRRTTPAAAHKATG